MISIPIQAEKIIKTLEGAGFEAYIVGGCVRDSLLSRTPNDWDITTSALPMQVKSLFSHTFDTGIKHGTVSVLMDGECFEVTTFRIDGEYEDGRHPREVQFTGCLKDDLLRRDFTINAMAYNPTTGLVDLYGGCEDLKNGIIRCVGNPEDRFTEDALRILRAIRFAAQLGYTLETETMEAMRKLSGRLSMISAERIQVELTKTIMSPHPDMLRTAYEIGITKVVLPELDACMETTQNNPHHMYTVGEHILHSLTEAEEDRYVRLAMLFHDMGKPKTKTTDSEGIDHFHGHACVSEDLATDIMRRLKLDNETIRIVGRLIHFHDERIPTDKRAVRRAMNRVGSDIFDRLMLVMRADLLAQSYYKRDEKLTHLSGLCAIASEILENRECIGLKQLAVTGKDLLEVGLAKGPEIGEILNAMLSDVLDDPSHNEKEYLLSMYVPHRD